MPLAEALLAKGIIKTTFGLVPAAERERELIKADNYTT